MLDNYKMKLPCHVEGKKRLQWDRKWFENCRINVNIYAILRVESFDSFILSNYGRELRLEAYNTEVEYCTLLYYMRCAYGLW